MAPKCAECNGKVALVTGGSKGIGRGCLELLAENGWTVAFWDIDATEGAVVENKYSERVFYSHCDVTDEEKIKKCMAETVSKFGKLDCLVNNVGNSPKTRPIDDFSTDDFRQILELNLVSCFAMCKYALPHLRRTKGNIVNIASVTVDCGSPGAVTYGASKAGVTTMTKCLAIDEAKHGVRVNAISPGMVRTPMVEAFAAERGNVDAVLAHVSNFSLMRRLADPREIGKACLFLATEATYCTGSVLFVTGGVELGFGVKPQ